MTSTLAHENWLTLTIVVLIALISVATVDAQSFKDELNQLRELRRQDRLSELCDWLDQLHLPEQNSLADERELEAQQELLFQAGDAYKIEADRLKQWPPQAQPYAEKAFALWKAWVGWYDNLRGARPDLATGKYSGRLFAVTAFLGQALVFLERNEDAVNEYEQINADYLGENAFLAWKRALLAGSLPQAQRPSICKDAVCREQWDTHWQYYSRTLRKRIPKNTREADQIDELLKKCNQDRNG